MGLAHYRGLTPQNGHTQVNVVGNTNRPDRMTFVSKGAPKQCRSRMHAYWIAWFWQVPYLDWLYRCVLMVMPMSMSWSQSGVTKSKSGSLTNSSAGEPDGVPNWPTGVPSGAGCVALRTVRDGVRECERVVPPCGHGPGWLHGPEETFG